MNRFEDTVVIITGPSDHGIGGAIAERLANEGALLFLFGLVKPEKLIKRLNRRNQAVFWHEGDVSNTDEVDAAIDACERAYGRIDVVVNNAGVELIKPFEQMSDDEWDQLLAVNLTGTMKVTRSALKYLTVQGGVIINIASALGEAGCPGFHAYSASKAGLIGMTRSLALELAPNGQRAVCVAPALVQTPMTLKHQNQFDQQQKDRLVRSHPLGVGMPQDVADVVAFLASQEARWISGISIPLGTIPAYDLPCSQPAIPAPTQMANTLAAK